MRFDEYRKYDAVALAALVAKGDVTAGELLELAIARAEQVNPAINAIVRTQYPRARAAVTAKLPGRPAWRSLPAQRPLDFREDYPAGLGKRALCQFRAGSRQRLYRALQAGGLVIMGRSIRRSWDLVRAPNQFSTAPAATRGNFPVDGRSCGAPRLQ